jgi:hypothetical protein
MDLKWLSAIRNILKAEGASGNGRLATLNPGLPATDAF